MTTRRDFIKKTVAGTAALSLGSIIPGFGSNSYQEILGANEKIRIGVIGVNSRGNALAQGFAKVVKLLTFVMLIQEHLKDVRQIFIK